MKLQHPSGFFFSVYITTSSLCAPLDSLLLAPLPLNTLHPFVTRFLAVLPPLLSFFLPLYPCRQEPSCTKWCDGCNWLTPPLPPIRSQLALGALRPLPTIPLLPRPPHSWGDNSEREEDSRWGGGSSGRILLVRPHWPILVLLNHWLQILKKKREKNHQLILEWLPFGSESRWWVVT